MIPEGQLGLNPTAPFPLLQRRSASPHDIQPILEKRGKGWYKLLFSENANHTLNAHPVGLFHPPMSPPSSPALSSCSVLPSSANSMPDEVPGPPPSGPRHIGEVDGPREILNVVDQVHSTG